MTTSDAKPISISSGEEGFPLRFSEWLKRRRKRLDLTQEQLAQRANCSVFAIRKIESGERRPSRQLARILAQSLEIPSEDQANFIKVSRGELSMERLATPARTSFRDPQPAVKSSPLSVNLPKALTPFIGREPELSTLGQLLCDPQCLLLTIVGPGGIGKTRLAIETANQYKDHFPDGVWFVSLAALNSPALLVPAIADAVNFRFEVPTNPQTQLLRYLCDKRSLIILDNAEHLLDGVGLFTEILNTCPQVKLLVTSRERLNLLSEWVFEIMGLPIPASDQVEQFETYSSVALFVQSARRVRLGFEIREDERRWALKICQTMEGMPLGIELAAAWVGLLPCQEIAEEIERNIDFLAVSMRDLPERHRSLRATLDHSWKLLNNEEKLILSRLSVFHSQFRREAAEEICRASFTVLSSLRNKTLLYRTDQDYFSLHELVRQYAERKLAEDPGEQERVKDRHASYYIQSLAKWEKALQSAQQVETCNEMAKVIDNLAQGWQHMITHCRPKAGKYNRLCADLLHSALFSLSWFYEMRCRSSEAITLFTGSIEYLKAIQGEFEETEDRSCFISVLGEITAYLGLHQVYVLQYEKAYAYLDEALQLLENSQSWIGRAQAQLMLAATYYIQGKLQKSAVLTEQSRDVFREAGQRWWYLLSLINLARTYLHLGRLQECEALYQEGFRLLEPGDVRLELMLRVGFASARYLQNDYATAEQLMQDNLELSYRFGNHWWTAYSYNQLSLVALSTYRVELAEKYLKESVNLLSEFGDSEDLALGLLYLGKCFVTQSYLEVAREKFRQVIKIGHTLNTFYLVYWASVNIARTYINEGNTEKALEISLVLKDYPVEYKEAQDEGNGLLADLPAMLPKEQVEALMKQVNGKISEDQAGAAALVDALEHVME